MFTRPTVADFKAYFARDFPYGADPNTSILDSDISRAQQEADVALNEGLFCTQAEYTIANNLLSAHMMCMNIKASSQGISGSFEWNTSSKGVGSVSVGLSIPQEIQDSPYFSYYSQTPYGAKYIVMVWPLIKGALFVTPGGTQA